MTPGLQTAATHIRYTDKITFSKLEKEINPNAADAAIIIDTPMFTKWNTDRIIVLHVCGEERGQREAPVRARALIVKSPRGAANNDKRRIAIILRKKG